MIECPGIDEERARRTETGKMLHSGRQAKAPAHRKLAGTGQDLCVLLALRLQVPVHEFSDCPILGLLGMAASFASSSDSL